MTETATDAVIEGLEGLLGEISIGTPYNLAVRGVVTHPVDERLQFGDWTVHILVEGTIDDETLVLHYDDVLSCTVRLYGQKAELNRGKTSKALWAFRNAIVAAIEGEPGIRLIGPHCDNWSIQGGQSVTGLMNGTSLWVGLVLVVEIVRSAPYTQ